MRDIKMQPNDREDSKDSDVYILEEISDVPSSFSSVKKDGLVSNGSNTFEETANKNGKFIGKPKLKRKKNISDQEYKKGNKYPKTANHSGKELGNVTEDGFKENVASTHPARPAYMCYECGEEFEREDLLKGHLLDHSFNVSKNTDLKNRTNKQQLMLGKSLSLNLRKDVHSSSSGSSNHSLDSLAIDRGKQVLDPKHSDSMSFSRHSKNFTVKLKGKGALVRKYEKLFKNSLGIRTENHTLDSIKANRIASLNHSKSSSITRSENQTLRLIHSNLLKKSREKGKPKLDPKPSKSLDVSDSSVDLIVIDSEKQTLDPKKANKKKSSVNSGGPSKTSKPKLSNPSCISNNSSDLMKIDNGNQTLLPNGSNSLRRSGLFAGSLLIQNRMPGLASKLSNSMKKSKYITSIGADSGNQTLIPKDSNQMEGSVHSEGSSMIRSGNETLDPTHSESLKLASQSAGSSVMKNRKQKLDPNSSRNDSLKVSDNSVDVIVIDSENQTIDPKKAKKRKSSVNSGKPSMIKTGNLTSEPKLLNSSSISINSSDLINNGNQISDPKQVNPMGISSRSLGSLSIACGNQTLVPNGSNSLRRSGLFAGSLLMENRKPKLDPKHSKYMKISKSFTSLVTDSGNRTPEHKKANQMKSSYYSKGKSINKDQNQTVDPKPSNSLKRSNYSCLIRTENQTSDPKNKDPLKSSNQSLGSPVIDSGNQILDPTHSKSLKRSSHSTGSLVMKNRNQKLDSKHGVSLSVNSFLNLLMADTGNQISDPKHSNSLKSSSALPGSSMIKRRNQTLDSKKRNDVCVNSEVSHDEIEVLIPEKISDITVSLPKPVPNLSYRKDKSTISRIQKNIEHSCQICEKKFKTHNTLAKHFKKTHKKQEDTTVFPERRSVEGASKDAEAIAKSQVDFRQVESVVPKQGLTENRTCLLAKLSTEVTITESVKDRKLKSTGEAPLGNSEECNGITKPQLTVNPKSNCFPQGDSAVREEGKKPVPEKSDQGPSKLLTARINTSKFKRADSKAKIAPKTPKALAKIPLVEIAESASSDKDLSKPFESSSNSLCSLAVENESQPACPKGILNPPQMSNQANGVLENDSKNVEALVAKGFIGSSVSIHKVIPVNELESRKKSSVNSYNLECKKETTIKQRKNSTSNQTIKPFLCEICGKSYRLQGHLVQHIKKKHGVLCNSSGTKERKKITESSGNLANSLADPGEVCVTIERKDAAENKIPVDHLSSLISEIIGGTEQKVTKEMPSGDNFGCFGTEDKAAKKLLSGNNNMECSSIGLPSYSNNDTRPINLTNSLVDFGQVDGNTQRKDAAQEKISVDLLGGNFPNSTSVVENETPDSVGFPNNDGNTSSNNLTNSSSSLKIVNTVINSVLPVQAKIIESPYSCPICFKKLSKDYVRIHIRLHQSKPFPCDLCDKAYVTRSKLNQHVSKCHTDNEKSLSESSVENLQKKSEVVALPASKSEGCNVQVDTSDVLCQNKIDSNGNEKKNDLINSAALENPNKELGNIAVGNTAVAYPEGKRLEPSKMKSHSQSKFSIGKSDPLNDISCNIPVESRNVQDENPLDLDVVVVDTIMKENEQNIENIRKEKEKVPGNLSEISIVHVVTIE